ncbi:T9SS type A sorting domain-containing protein [Parabacteroides sp. OttesenSCG-928-G07]|nr:T9SS type A sorting domain-containing protein [Parabacteroides sp. OttesenSCG-928-G07]
MKYVCLIYRNLFFSLLFLVCFPSIVLSQVDVKNPASWNDFVQSQANPFIRDTFIMQTFSNPLVDNWGYSSTGNVSLFDANAAGIRNASQGMALKIEPGANVRFDKIDVSGYKETWMQFPYAIEQAEKGENLGFKASLDGENERTQLWTNILKLHSSHFKERKEYGVSVKEASFIQIKGVNDIDLFVSAAAANTKNGYYLIDSAFVFGDIQAYSLFSGTGNWMDRSCWSHLPAQRYRHALIQGDVTVNEDTSCESLMVGNGSVHIASRNTLKVNQLVLNGSTSALYAYGDVSVKKEIIVNIPFPEKGQWYFISFPFDVYANDIDKTFQLQDDKFSGKGNYFYVLKYNGEKRGLSQQTTGNWEVIPAQQALNNGLVFEKHKGYLISLDGESTQQSISFTTKDVFQAFNTSATIRIDISQPSLPTEDSLPHHGWVLCGNPFPAPLLLSQIQATPDLDEYIYYYEDGAYKAYPITSDYAIPPYGAFFMKVKRSTEVEINNILPKTAYRLLSSSPMFTAQVAEPVSEFDFTTNPIVDQQLSPFLYYKNGFLYIQNLTDKAQITLYDLSGRKRFHQIVSAETAMVPIHLMNGVYFAVIETTNDSFKQKLIIKN